MLPAYGKYFNPCRNLQMDYLNSHVRQMYQQCQPYKEGRQRTFDQLQNDLQKSFPRNHSSNVQEFVQGEGNWKGISKLLVKSHNKKDIK